MSEMPENSNRVNCFKCVHFSITWETKYPKACNLFGFKTAGMPSAMVYKSTGAPCNAFVAKKP